MNVTQIGQSVEDLVKSINEESFFYDFISCFGTPKATVKRLQEGGLNLSKNHGEILWKKKVFFRVSNSIDLHLLIDSIKSDPKVTGHSPRFIIVTDYETLLSIDTKTGDSLDTPLLELDRHFDFFLPLAGMEKAQHQFENPADVKAAERMGKLYDEIKKDNSTDTEAEVHDLNVFLTRLLFCFFAEDTNIFEKSQFTHSVINHTQDDGSDLDSHFERLFQIMNLPNSDRGSLPAYLDAFPYVNGGLFRNQHGLPKFSRKSRQLIIESGELDWSAINPDIFGSMIQAVITPEHRGGLGMHYTSVPNIMKVIEPLFLNDFNEEFEASKGNPKALRFLLNRLWKTKYFDPACGSGNFLIIAYKELRKLEMKIIKELKEMVLSNISLSQFYGIEFDDFAHEVAILSLWLAEHQMNQLFFKEFGIGKPALPLTSSGSIVHGNACRLIWENVCPKVINDEIYIFGNPPYLGARLLSDSQKEDMELVFKGNLNGYNDLDYIAPWFFKASNYILNINSKCAFVSTNSICQGSQVSILWPSILNNVEIDFVHKSFKWTNNAKSNAAVIVIIIGLRNNSAKPKYMYENNIRIGVNNINSYLINGENIFIYSRRTPLSKLPEMNFGSMPNDGGFLTLSEEEYTELISSEPKSTNYIKKFAGSKEFINNSPRWCIWIEESDLHEALKIKRIEQRVNQVKNHREKSDREATNLLSNVPYKFAEIRYKKSNSIIVPATSSERREYIPIGFLNEETVISNSANAIYDSEPWVFALINSKMHMTWLRAVAGRLKSDYRYSTALCYNTFPFLCVNENLKLDLNRYTFLILEQREKHSEKTLAQLYDPDKMPDSLKDAHHQLDLAVERCYRSKPFESDEERLEYLFKLYEQMIEEEKSRGTLFEMESKPKKKKK
ncbi:DNA methyltransferase [Aquirufa echingensis]|uniref:site-specific DNA-methyltransferase (adenine-specific) n=1 Tax=Aquirufa echingensis TaxID=3096516 RepID=A0ABW6CZV2_9BACT